MILSSLQQFEMSLLDQIEVDGDGDGDGVELGILPLDTGAILLFDQRVEPEVL